MNQVRQMLPLDLDSGGPRLTDADVCGMLGRKSIGKLELVLTDQGVFKRDTDGCWYRLSAEAAT